MRLTRAEIHLSSLKYNFDGIRQRVGSGVKIMGVVKANAYGHGSVEIARALIGFGCEYLGVAILEEGIELRKAGISAPVLVLGGVLGSQISEFLHHDLEITVSSIEIGERINREVKAMGRPKARVHLKIDTGMERIGVRAENAPVFVERMCRLPFLDVVGVYTHLATSDERDQSFAMDQLRRFDILLRHVDKAGLSIPLMHVANSGAIIDLPSSYYSMVRPGIMLYGYYPSLETSESIPLRRVLRLKSNVVFKKEVGAGVSLSYGRKFITPSRTMIITVPIGYADGYPRRLTNRTDVIIHGTRYPAVGTICMDQMMVNIGMNAEISVGDEVCLLGDDGKESISAWELTNKIESLPYELLSGIAPRVPRVYIN